MRIQFGEFELDPGRRQLLRGGEEVHLPPKGLLLLQLLIEKRPNAIGKREIYDQLWPSTFVSDVNLPGLIAELRTALGDDARNPRFIRTVHGFGYAFCAETSAPPPAEDAYLAILFVKGRELRIREGETIIGRDQALQACIDDPTVSRNHAAIVCTADTATIRDLDSKNGTFVEGVRIGDAIELHDGDTVVIGSVEGMFRRAKANAATITFSPSS